MATSFGWDCASRCGGVLVAGKSKAAILRAEYKERPEDSTTSPTMELAESLATTKGTK